MSEEGARKEFLGEARIGKVVKGLTTISLRPEDFSSPVALQMAFSRIFDAIMNITLNESGPKHTYVAEVKFVDDLGNPVVFAVDLGEEIPPFSKEKVKARIRVELFEEED